MTHCPRFITLGLLLAGLLLAACGAPPTAPADGVIVRDDFADPQSGWDRHTGAEITTDYVAGQYVVGVQPANLDAWGLAGLDLNDMAITATATRLAGPADNAFGLMCRHTRAGDQNNFYFFLISSDGYYAVGKVQRDARSFLNPAGDFEPLAAIDTADGAVNTLTAVCQGAALSFTVNGAAVGVFSDGDLTHGDVGLIAGTFAEGGVQIGFDDALITVP